MELYLPETAEGRAVAQIVAVLGDGSEPGAQMATVRKLSRIALRAMVALAGPEMAAAWFISLSHDALKARGCGKGRKRA